ncbi:MAG: DNA polymerase III subunit gamma/tau [Rhodospirillaceae bacterium]|nr:DNA polymerase III subunit gamma/tau [Rhodospirillaceae bacterium]
MIKSEMDEDIKPVDYKVLARKYRPVNFASLIGQEPMVRTLKNAFHSDRVAHAFILTGVRGVGKTTTARIIARSLNCVGNNKEIASEFDPCGNCDFCRTIIEGSCIDVIEMDAASRTGVDDIRELIESVRYKPVSAKYKVYIVDEVHMLSRNAFNALLKTLEEPPSHVKFIFATTEIRKVPVTVLSRCQRFDLRRIETEVLANNFREISNLEGLRITDDAINLIARAADGSVRDGQSLLDQVVSLGLEHGNEVVEEDVREILGLADRKRIFELFEEVMKGKISNALKILADDYRNGTEPNVVVKDLLEIVHWLTKVKVCPELLNNSQISEIDLSQGRILSTELSMATLTRAWQLLLKGLNEVALAPSPINATEMLLIRLAYFSNLPTPADLVKKLNNNEKLTGIANKPVFPDTMPNTANDSSTNESLNLLKVSQQKLNPQVEDSHELHESALADLNTFEDVLKLANIKNERILFSNLTTNVHLVRFEPGTIVFHPEKNAPRELSQDLANFLNTETGRRWIVTLSMDEPGEPTYQQRQLREKSEQIEEAAKKPFIKSVLKLFPGAKISDVK